MTTDTHAPPTEQAPGPMARLGAAMADRFGLVVVAWIAVVVALGAAAPSVFTSLAGAGWQADGSESVQVRELAAEHFGGTGSDALQVVVHSETHTVDDPEMVAAIAGVTDVLAADPRIAGVVAPQQGMTISPDGHTAIVIGGAAADPNEMVTAAGDLADPLAAVAAGTSPEAASPEGIGVEIHPTGASALWSDFNAANHDAMIKAEMVSWPVTLAIMVLAFGSLVAAGLPLLLTMAGLVASAGALVLLGELTPISVWAMNFAMMFALALGIDYALFLVVRFRDALRKGVSARVAVVETMDTAGKAVLLSGLTVLVSLSAVLLVPAPAVRTMAVGIMLAVLFVLAATLTLLPAVLGKLGPKVNAGSLPYAKRQQHRSPWFGRWGAVVHRRPWPLAIGALGVLVLLSIPVFGLKVAMPSIHVVPEDAAVRQGYEIVQEQMGDGVPGTLQIVADAQDAEGVTRIAAATEGVAQVSPAIPATSGGRDGEGPVLVQAVPDVDPSDPALADVVDRLRADLPESAIVGGAPAENLDLQRALNDYLPIVMAVILVLGFLLLLVALRAPLVALMGTVVSLLSTGAAFGVAKLIFQDGHGAGLLGFEPQGFLDGWGPVFFFAMIFAIAMDYTVFLLATVKEHYERTGDATAAQREGMAHSGRIIFAAAAVMVGVFFSFALAEPLPPKEMGIILGVAVLLDAVLVRLVLLPALLRLTGRAAWWSPSWLRRMLPEISFSHG
ncbi:MMPL family transporter [Rhodococcus gannanensis]|uniref:MMPL family transporter n=1 Tax=Rhodococcus gannanensis TaxID=1960308 RepID=A0ABW4P6Z4_9NOCA